MDYEKIVSHLGEIGRYQKLLTLKTYLPIFIGTFSVYIPNFCLGVHNHRCKIPWLENDTYQIQDSVHADIVNYTIPLTSDGTYDKCNILLNGSIHQCESWVYDQLVFTETLISQFDLVCGRRLYKSHAILMTFLGYLLSPLILNPQADIFGRRRMYCICIAVLTIVNLTIPFSVNIYMFGALRFLDGFFYLPMYAFAFVFVMELVGARTRNIVCVLTQLTFCMGELWLALFAYLIRNWKWLYFSCAVFYIPFLIYMRPGVLPESPRWLISKGRTDEAFKTIQKAAKVNKVSLPKGANALKVSDQESLPFSTILRQLGRSRKLLIYLAIAMSNWFVVAMTTFGMKMNISHLGSNVYTSFTITVIADTLGTLLMFTMDRVGHKRLLVISVLSTGAACAVSFILILFVDNVSEWLIIAFVMIGKLFNATEFGMAYTYTGELFPTDIRAFVLGSCSFFARIGSLASPYLYQIGEGKMQKALPLIVYSTALFVVGLVSLTLPETTQWKLPDQIDDSLKNKTQSSLSKDELELDKEKEELQNHDATGRF